MRLSVVDQKMCHYILLYAIRLLIEKGASEKRKWKKNSDFLLSLAFFAQKRYFPVRLFLLPLPLMYGAMATTIVEKAFFDIPS